MKKIRVFCTPNDLDHHIRVLAKQITREYKDKGELVVVGVLNGAFIFMADLIRQLHFPFECDFVGLASYTGTESTGNITITKDLTLNIKNKRILIVEDIVDSGLTLSYLIDYLKQREPIDIKTCAVIDRQHKRKTTLQVDWAIFHPTTSEFFIGYGLDHDGYFRNMPSISYYL